VASREVKMSESVCPSLAAQLAWGGTEATSGGGKRFGRAAAVACAVPALGRCQDAPTPWFALLRRDGAAAKDTKT